MSYKPGDYLVICDQCGFQRYASECQMTWNNLFVCADTCWESKHEQFTPPKPLGEKQSVPVRRTEDTLAFVDTVDDSSLEATTTSGVPNDGYFITTPITGDDL
jgi:hypothetical protein